MCAMSFLNGRLPSAALGKIHNGRLRRDAARAWNAMNMESRGRFGVTLRPTGSMSSYRTYAQQVYLRNLYLSGRGNLAAVPGTSNHGEGLAVDLATLRMRQIVDEIGAKYGWSKRWSDAPREWWHIKWRSGVWNKKAPYGPRILTKGSRGRDVLKLKSLMYGKGLRNFDRFTPIFGDGVKAALIRYQKKHGMTPDGVAGPKTWHRLLS
jgi:peptidoglycan hydrolase-like protein with peptidoglycan-binding domain